MVSLLQFQTSQLVDVLSLILLLSFTFLFGFFKPVTMLTLLFVSHKSSFVE